MSAPFYPQGRYLCRVTNQGIGEAKTGTPQVVIRFEVLQMENGEQVQQVYERTAYLYLTEKSAPRTIECLKALGYTRDSFKFLDKSLTNHHDLTNQEFTGFCAHEKDQNDQPREKWGIALDTEFEVTPLDSRKIRELDNLFGESLKAAAPAPRQRAVATSTAVDDMPPHGPIDDDLPF